MNEEKDFDEKSMDRMIGNPNNRHGRRRDTVEDRLANRDEADPTRDFRRTRKRNQQDRFLTKREAALHSSLVRK